MNRDAVTGNRFSTRRHGAYFRAVFLWALLTGWFPLEATAAIQFAEGAQLPILTGSGTDVALGDVDGDGDLDLMVAVTAGSSRLLINQGRAQNGTAGNFLESNQNLGAGASQGVALADIDGDGDLDAFFVDRLDAGANQVWLNRGGAQGGVPGTFSHNGQTIGDDASTGVALGNLDANAGLDAFVARAQRRPDKVWFRSGADQFTDSGQSLGAEEGFAVALGDVDGDGDLDAMVGNAAGTGGNKLWINQSGAQAGTAGTFVDSGQDLRGAAANTTGVALGDLDADGDLDAFFAKGITGEVWLNQGEKQGGARGAFLQSGQGFGPSDNAISREAALGDLDGDGDLDAFVARFGPAVVFENDGRAGLSNTGLRLGEASTRSAGVALGDLDGDGDLDAVVVNSSAPVQIWRNETTPSARVPGFPEYIITTAAGNGNEGSNGDGGSAVAAELNAPSDIVLDAAGNLFIAERNGHRVRKVTTEGVILTFAGTGVAGFSGDGGAATQAQMFSPIALAVGNNGEMYIGETRPDQGAIVGMSYVRKVTADGMISTIIGHPSAPITLEGGDGGPAAQANLWLLWDVTADEIGNVYLSQEYRVRKVDTNGMINAFAGQIGSTPLFAGDGGPAVDALLYLPQALVWRNGELVIADTHNDRIRKVDGGGTITTIVGRAFTNRFGDLGGGYLGSGGQATNAVLYVPKGMAFDSAGNLIFADSANNRIRRVDTNGIISTIAGTGRRGFSPDGALGRTAALGGLSGVAVDRQDNIYFVEGLRIRRLSRTGNHIPFAARVSSIPGPGGTIDIGRTDPRSFPISRELRVGNSGNADLVIESISNVTPEPLIKLTVGPYPESLPSPPVPMPHVIPDGLNDAELLITLEAKSDTPALASTVLRIVSNDPVRPEADYPVVAGFSDEGTALEQAILFLFLLDKIAGPPPERRMLKAASTGAGEVRRGMLVLDTNSAHIVTAEVPGFFGGGSVAISNFTGSLTVLATPLPNDADQMAIAVEKGEFVAASVQLPNGIETGVNRLIFGSTNQSGGTLVLSNGNYSVFASAQNDLFPGGFRVSGTYTGVFDQGTGRISVRSNSKDYFERTPRLNSARTQNETLLTWTARAFLEGATNVIGPWQRMTNASPFSIQGRSLPKEFFRLIQPPP